MNDETHRYLSDSDRAVAGDLRFRPGDQQLPTHRVGVPGTHDQVIDHLLGTGTLVSGRPFTPAMCSAVVDVLVARREVGLSRYGTVLQPDSGRDTGRDALEESADLVVYLWNGIREGRPWDRLYGLAVEILVDLTAQTGGLS
jgi:hypothetical protein